MSILFDPVIALQRASLKESFLSMLYIKVHQDFIHSGKQLEATGKFMLKSFR